jgi:alkylation response protein AidB-like acyl-CoA dehydrogenase
MVARGNGYSRSLHMDLALTEIQEMLRVTAREFLERECPTTLVRAMEADDRGYPAQLWEGMAALDWMGLAFPEEHGGTGGTLTDLAVLLEEIGRALAPGPFFASVVNVGLAVLDAGSEGQRREYIPQLASGTLIGTAALLERDARHTPDAINLSARRVGDVYELTGSKMFVEYANTADLILVPVRTDSSATPDMGLTILLVPATSSGIELTRLDSIARDAQFEVSFEGVEVPADAVLGEVGAGWSVLRRALDRATVLHCAVSVGGAQRVLEMTVEYAKQRVQFGRPIGSFQSVQHDCADMVNAIDAARLATYQALARLEDGEPGQREIALAKILTDRAYKSATLTAQQIHGGIGFMEEYDLQLWTRRARVAELKYGGSAIHRETFAASLGLV